MKIRRIITEDARVEQWKMLAHFFYEPNIQRFLAQNGLAHDRQLTNFIAGCLRQGQAYFEAAERSPLDISPLLYYYGLTNLLSGAAALIKGTRLGITNHGMTLRLPDSQSAAFEAGDLESAVEVTSSESNLALHLIAEVEVVPNHPKDGALHLFSKCLCPDTIFPAQVPWRLEEIFASIPDLRSDFSTCYPTGLPMVVPIEVVRRRQLVLDRLKLEDFIPHPDAYDALQSVEKLRQAYIQPQPTSDKKHIVLRPKIGGVDIGVYSMFGEKFLALSHRKNNHNVTPPPILILLMALFALGYLSRYLPEVWNPFIRTDETGERMVVERLLHVCGRYAPNLVLNEIYKERMYFLPPSFSSISALDEEDVKNIIKEEIAGRR